MDSSIYGYSPDDFKEEAKELLSKAETILTSLDDDPGDMELINALFRTIHSLKGSAAYVGLPEVNDFSHLFESTLGEIRGKKRECDTEVVSVLTRSRDYLDDLIFNRDETEAPNFDEAIEDPFERLRAVFSAGGGAGRETPEGASSPDAASSNEASPETAAAADAAATGVAATDEPLACEDGKAEPAPETGPEADPEFVEEEPAAAENGPEEITGEDINVSTDDHSEMGESDVIKVTVKKAIQSLYEVLKVEPLDSTEAERVLDKLEETVQWAFGDEAIGIMIPLEEMTAILGKGVLGIDELAKLRKGYNMLVPELKKEILALDGDVDEEMLPDVTDGSKGEMMEDTEEAEEIRGASRDEIVRISLTSALGALRGELTHALPDGDEVKRLIDKLRDLNQWIFDEDDEVTASLNSMEDLIHRIHDGKAVDELRSRCESIDSLLERLAEENISHHVSQATPPSDAAGDAGRVVAGEAGETKDEAPRPAPPAEDAGVAGPDPARGEGSTGERHVDRRRTGKKGPRRSWSPVSSSTLKVKTEDVETLINTVGDISGLDAKEFERLHAATLELRMVHVGELLSRFRKITRDLSEELGKEIDIEITGESVKLDKAIADKLGEPLMHLVRNAASHGIETPDERVAAGKGKALIRINAYQEGGQVIIQVSDNGRGISVEKVKTRAEELGLLEGIDASTLTDKRIVDFIFSPGFSTKDGADKVSGRGVGMDVVKEVIGALQGAVNIDTVEGEGTTFMLQLPLTLAVIRGLVLEQSGNKIAVPAGSVDRVMNMTEQELTAGTFMDKNRLSLYMPDEGEIIPLVNFCSLFGLEKEGDKRCVVLVKVGGGHKVALIVDAAIGRQPLAVKPLDKFSETRHFSSASIVEGEVVLILNVPSLLAAA